MLADNGYYSNRSDFINQALRNLLQQQQSTLDRIIDKNSDTARKNANQWFVGIYNLDAATLEELLSQGGGGTIHGYGVFAIDDTSILKECAHQMNRCVIIVTHSGELAKQADMVFHLKNGELASDYSSEI